MNRDVPRTPFATPLSGSAREIRMRLEYIRSGPKRRPPAPLLVLVAMVCLLCGNLVSCQVWEETPPALDGTTQNGPVLTRYNLPGEGVREMTLEGRWVLALEDVPVADDDTAQITELVCRDLETGAYEIWESLYYNPYGGAADTIRLYPFENIMGHSGVLLSSQVEYTDGGVPVARLFICNGGVPTLIARCEGTLYTSRVDGFDILLAAHPYGYDGRRGGATLYWQEGDGTLRSRPLREALQNFLGLSWDVLVSLSLEVLEEEGALSLCWQPQGAPVQTVDLPLPELLAYAREQAARGEEVPVDHVNGQLLKLVLEEHRLESEYGWDTFEVDRILVYQGEQLIQTLLPEDWLGSAEFGLFVCDGGGLGSLGQPLTLDLNWDGVQDFGLMCMEGGARNVPYLYFVWNGEGFSPVAVLCAPAEVDPKSRQIVERVCEGNGVDTVNWYEFGGGGQLELVRSETNTVPDGIG